MSSGEFVGMVADDAAQKIKLKTFHNEILNDHTAIDQEANRYKEIPPMRNIMLREIQDNYMQVKLDISEIIRTEMDKLRELKKKKPISEQ